MSVQKVHIHFSLYKSDSQAVTIFPPSYSFHRSAGSHVDFHSLLFHSNYFPTIPADSYRSYSGQTEFHFHRCTWPAAYASNFQAMS